VIKDYPEDVESRLHAPGRWRLSIHVGSSMFFDLLGFRPEHLAGTSNDFSQVDVFLPHPVYGAYGWVAVVSPGRRTTARALGAIGEAHAADRRRVERRFDPLGLNAVCRAIRRPSSALPSDQTCLVRDDRRLNAVPGIQLDQDRTDMGLDGALHQVQPPGDLPVGQTLP
jgi:hypothetical protein